MMDGHFWPSIYPAIIVGVFVAFSARSLSLGSVLAGALGGLVGGVAGLLFLRAIGMDQGITGSVGTMAGGALFAWLCLVALQRVNPPANNEADQG